MDLRVSALKFSVANTSSNKGNIGWINLNLYQKKYIIVQNALNLVKLVSQ